MSDALPRSARRVHDALAAAGLAPRIVGLPQSARTAADADFVRHATGFAIGGVPPLGHARPSRTLVDEDSRRSPSSGRPRARRTRLSARPAAA